MTLSVFDVIIDTTKEVKCMIITEINRIVLVGKHEYPEKKTTFSSRQTDYQELIYHFSGEATVEFNDQVLQTKKDSIRYLPAGECRRYTVDRKEHGECIDIVFSSDTPLNTKAFVTCVNNEKIGALFKKAFLTWIQRNDGYYFECLSIVYKILAELQKSSYTPIAQAEKVKPALDYIQTHFLTTETISSEHLAHICGISYSCIKKWFARKFGVSPKRYILQLKMNYACDLLRHGEHTVSEIADICGYSDVYTFSHGFKAEFGISPTDFAKKYKSSK